MDFVCIYLFCAVFFFVSHRLSLASDMLTAFSKTFFAYVCVGVCVVYTIPLGHSKSYSIDIESVHVKCLFGDNIIPRSLKC